MTRMTALDRWATSGSGWLHRASPVAKWLLLLTVVAVAALARDPGTLVLVYLLLVGATVTARLPVRPLLLASLAPLPLVALFAVSQWDGRWQTPAAMLAKAVVTALAGLMVAASTPYPDLLAPLTRILPRTIGDSLVLTYRSLFILVGRVEALTVAIRARGGLPARAPVGLPWPARGASLRRRLDVVATGGALALLRGVDLSNRLYDTMRLRGYEGRLAPTRSLRLSRSDWPVLALGGSALLLAAALRLAKV